MVSTERSSSVTNERSNMTAPTPDPLLTGLRVGECARWHDDRLWLANWGEGQVLAVEAGGNAEPMVELDKATLPISIDWLGDGTLLVIPGAQGLVLRRDADGSLVTYAELSGLSPH